MVPSLLTDDGTLAGDLWTPLTQGLEPAQSRPPKGVDHGERSLKAWDGTTLFMQTWVAPGAPRRGRVALMHGYGEHSTRYMHVAAALARAGYAVAAIDARGHGKSQGRGAHVTVYDDYVLDLERLCDSIDQEFPEAEWGPLFVLGHSNGGLIALRYALRNPERVRAFAVTSPMCGLRVKVPKWKAGLGQVMSKVWPTLALPTELDPRLLSHKKNVVQQYRTDPLNKTIATARWFTEAQAAQADLIARAGQIQKPVLMLSAGEDGIVDSQAAQRCHQAMTDQGGQRVFRLIPGAYHESLNEDDWADTLGQVVAWFEQHRQQGA